MGGIRSPAISARLRAVASMVPEGSRVADIGTDHGLLPTRLLASGQARSCIATEMTEGRLEKAHRTLGRAGAPVELRAARGLDALDPRDRLDVLVIAGLGGKAIVRILDDPRLEEIAPRRLVLQPQTDPADVRRWLAAHGFRLVDERLVPERRRTYTVMAAEPGGGLPEHPSLSREDLLEAGPCLVRSDDPAVASYWREQARRCVRILETASPGRAREKAERILGLARRVLAALPGGRP